MLYSTPEMAIKQSITKKRQQSLIVSFILAIGHIELGIFHFVMHWIVSVLCVLSGAVIAYLTFYFFVVLPTPTNLSQYQRIPSIAIFDRKGTLLYKEWNTQRRTISLQDVVYYHDVLPSKENMALYLASHSNNLKTTKDIYWFQKKMMYLYQYNRIAATYMNAKIFQNGVVGFCDAAEIYFKKDCKAVEKNIAKTLLNPQKGLLKKNIYARMPTETSAIRAFVEKKIIHKKIGWIQVETSLDAQIGAIVEYKSLLNPNNSTIVMQGDKVLAWAKENDQLLAAKAIIKTKEGGEYNE